ncbi:acetate--CoA ligase family protein [Ottowia thiooxydans]|uniref:acetate--CoA ligase family protein n=1 Tax=Ottowia thiooxydans TaxID=219182 RepID=UPI0006881377|nr:acetate--CoA ligase family protein [Ottowia thiooxydans]
MTEVAKTSTRPDMTALFTPPRSIVMYGASDSSQWSRSIFASIRAYGFEGPIYAVNQRGAPAHGLPGFTSALAIPEPVDMGYVFVPSSAVVGALEDLADAGIRTVVILSSGFSEVGEEGKALQEAVVEVARRRDITFMGPNSLGFAHVANRWALAALPPPQPLLSGHVAVISQSGAICSEIADYAVQQGIGLSFICAVGNEAMVDVAAVIEALADDPSTRSIALFVESIRNPADFARAAEIARLKAKPVVVFKVGASDMGAAVAQAHTGSLVGNDQVFDAACERHAIVRVESVEDLVTTAGLLAHTGVIEKPGVALVSLSGGGCGVVADYADKLGIPMPAFSAETVQKLRCDLPDFAATLNPFDITGAAIRNPQLFVSCLRAVGSDPSIGLVIAGYSLFSDETRLTPRLPLVTAIGEGLRELGSRGILSSSAVRPYTGAGLEVLREHGIRGAFGGLAATLRAVKKALWWSARVRQTATVMQRMAISAQVSPRLVHERDVLLHLSHHGVPVIPAIVVQSPEQALAAQRDLNGPVALKILSPDIAHKTEVGGVRLNVTAQKVAKVYEELVAEVRSKAPSARLEGVIVSPMRDAGLELFVSVTTDAQWGPVLTLGLGGVWIEVLRDCALRLLPVTPEQVRDMLGELRGARLLHGWRGAPAADLDALTKVIACIGDAALALGPKLSVLEVNPLRVGSDGAEALDGLAIWKDEDDSCN